METKKINICIVHYNTPKLTECLVKSINKFVPCSKIYIFDNSDKFPFEYRQDNIVYIDNTKGQIINFDEWLNSIKTKVNIGNKHASAKHCYTIQKCMELIDDNFILLDSDVLLKRDITELFEEQYIYVGDTEKWQGNSRVIPYCCFINTKMCKDNGVNYYNEKYIVGLTKNCRYDTGAYFWLSCQNFPHKNIRFADYVLHLDDGSQKYQNTKNHDMWLMKNKSLYDIQACNMEIKDTLKNKTNLITICIVHYNTPKLTECLIKSINKFTPNSEIYVFDNSDEYPFTYKQSNIIYIDNTKGQIINFDEWLMNYPNKDKVNYSSKHAYSIQKCIELIDKPFILMDSDILIKKDVSELYNENFAFIGEFRDVSRRVVPFICFINTNILKDKDIKYFDDNYSFDLYKNGKGKMRYDTGCMLYLNKDKLPHKEIKTSDYIVHYSAGSYSKDVFNILHKGQISKEKWLKLNENLWNEINDDKMTNKNLKYKDALYERCKRLGINIDNPKTIQEKIQWLKIHDSTPLKTKCADKIKVHEYCKEKLGEDICIPILKIYNSADEIKWSELPDSFVLKCNHGSGMNIIVKNKSNVSEEVSKQKIKKWLATDFAFQNGYEMQYNDIERKAFVEKLIGNGNKDIPDYKISCFNGEPKFIQIMNDRYLGKLRFNYYDMEFNPLYYSRNDHPANYSLIDPKPKNFDVMIDYAKKLSQDFKYVRVDFYEVDGKVYLGELTFTPGSGFFSYKDNNTGLKIGNLLNLGDYAHDIEKNKKVIYTCITGSYEPLDDPFVISPGYDYVCFTNDDKIQSNIWQIRPIPEELNGLSEVKKQRCIKINAHKYLPEYDFSIWVDGSVKLRKDVNEFVESNCKDGHIFIPTHPTRNCIYKEMDACIRAKKDTATNIEPQKNRYKKEEFPKNFGLVQSNIMLRYHNEPDCIKLMETWWEEVKNGSHRDQLSFDYARWKNPGAKFVFLDKKTCTTEYFKWDPSHGKSIRRFTPTKSSQTSRLQKIRRDVEETKSIIKNSEDVKPENKIVEEKKTTRFKTSIPIKTTPVIRRRIITNKLRKFIEQR